MLVVVDAAAAGNNSVGVVVAGWLHAWNQVVEAVGDEVHLVASRRFVADEDLAGLPNVVVHPFGDGAAERLKAQHVTVPRLLRALPADVLLGSVPQIPMRPVKVPVVVVSYDFRHELRPGEFSRARRALRWLEYRRAYRRADRIATISERTRADLARLHPKWASKAAAVPLGSDHLSIASVGAGGEDGIALAYAHHTNKRPELVIRAWAYAAAEGVGLPPLTLVGASATLVAELAALRDSLGLTADRVRIQSFLPHDEYERLLATVRVIVLASTFEGFGLPVLEGLRLRRPVVITPEPAMVEVGGPAVTVSDGETPEALARAVAAALDADCEQARDAGLLRADEFTWAHTVTRLRHELEAATSARG